MGEIILCASSNICIFLWKILVLVGLGMAFSGLVLMIESRIYRSKEMGTLDSTNIIHPWYYRIGWVLTIVGFILQVFGVVIST